LNESAKYPVVSYFMTLNEQAVEILFYMFFQNFIINGVINTITGLQTVFVKENASALKSMY